MAPPRKIFTVEQRRAVGRAKQARYAENYKGMSHGHIMAIPKPTLEMMTEREFALGAPRTLSQELCGDPLRGRSALDKMRVCAP
jgi:hypothetical protein